MKLGWYHDVAHLDADTTESGMIGRPGFDGIPFSASARTSRQPGSISTTMPTATFGGPFDAILNVANRGAPTGC